MKCPNCGKEIANDSQFCEFCGTKMNSSVNSGKNGKQWKWYLLGALGICAIIIISLLVFGGKSNSNDFYMMNLHGSVDRFTEITYFTNTETNQEEKSDHSGIFDDAIIPSILYGNEHMACIYTKFFLSQVSDCEIKFNTYGNIISIRSINNDGGMVKYRYDKNYDDQVVVEMDTRVDAGNQNEGIITYEYSYDGGHVSEEIMSIQSEYGVYNQSISYTYNFSNQLTDAFYNNGNGLGLYFKYDKDRLVSVDSPNFWGNSRDLSIKFEYNKNGDIESVTSTGKKGRSESARKTTFEYKYDSHNNWIERKGTVTFISGEVYKIRTVRNYQYN